MVVEVTSRSTRREDLADLYEQLGVEEYFLFDILGEYLSPRLQGYRLRDGRYQALQPGPGGALVSETIGIILVPETEALRLVDAATGEILLRPEEMEAEVARLKEELARLRKE
jgi:Uma2 family endonuclease